MTNKQKAIKLVSSYFSQVTGTNYKHSSKTFNLYEQIAKNYAIISILESKIIINADDEELINEIKAL
jgi:hypothetical protein